MLLNNKMNQFGFICEKAEKVSYEVCKIVEKGNLKKMEGVS